MVPLGRCYTCFRPQSVCFCESIPRIENRTEVLILQHRRERFHRFNTARIVHQALVRSQLLIGHVSELGAGLNFGPRAALLYPGAPARLISELPEDERPEQLVILDGTWHHAKTLMRELAALRALPRLRLAPTEPSRYRIRREPNVTSLSTVEATVAALRELEPETAGLEQLLAAFETMVEDQLAHPGSASGARFSQRTRAIAHVPLQLLGSLEHVVVAYGEAPAGMRGCKKTSEPPISWVAQRLGDGATFSHTLVPPRSLDDTFLEHLQLTRADFAEALTLTEAQRRWKLFQRPQDVVVVFQPGTARQFSYLAGPEARCLVLKSVPRKALAECQAADDSPSEAPNPGLGRAGKRLAETISLVRQLNALATLAREVEHA